MLTALSCDFDENSMIANLLFLEGLAFQAGRHNRVAASDDVVLVGADEIVLSEDELVKQLVLVDGCFSVCHEDLEDVSADECHEVRCRGNLSDRDILSGHYFFCDDWPVLDPVLVEVLAIQVQLVPELVIVDQHALLILDGR